MNIKKVFIILICVLIGIALTLFLLKPFKSPEWWLALVCAGFAVFLIWARKTTKEFDQIPEQSTEAIIIAKNEVTVREETSASGRGDGSDNTYTYKTHYKITFENQIHVQWSFDVSLKLYNAVLEGDSGTLVYKETQQGQMFFISFLRH